MAASLPLLFAVSAVLACFVKSQNDCTLSPEKGPCDDDIEMYYYDASTKTCETFTYGGCEGNNNKFPTKEECLVACGDV
uniref:Putative Protease inhibitor n=1 Tax=Megacormus gertschi TaxID=1843536 RepID=A0A224X8I5_9SCOR